MTRLRTEFNFVAAAGKGGSRIRLADSATPARRGITVASGDRDCGACHNDCERSPTHHVFYIMAPK